MILVDGVYSEDGILADEGMAVFLPCERPSSLSEGRSPDMSGLWAPMAPTALTLGLFARTAMSPPGCTRLDVAGNQLTANESMRKRTKSFLKALLTGSAHNECVY